MSDKKLAPKKPVAKAAKAAAKAPPPKPAANTIPKTPAKTAKKAEQKPSSSAKAPLKAPPPPKAAAKKAAAAPKAPAKPEPKTKAAATKPVPASPKTETPKPAPKAKAAAVTPEVTKPPVKAAQPKPEKSTKKAAKEPASAPSPVPAAEAKAAPAKAEKPAKAPKAPKPPKLAPVEAAFAKPKPSRPLAVAAGRAQPLVRTLATPPARVAPKPLASPKPVAVDPEPVGEQQAVPAFKSKANGTKDLVLVGAVAGAFGVKGEVRLRAFTERKEGVISYGPLYSEDGRIMLKPKSWRELKDGVAVVAAEVKSREEAEQMRGTKLFVPRANLPAPEEDEFYIVDLLGCRAEAIDGKVLGEICAVWNFGAGDIIEYRPPNGGPNVRVTFTKQTAPLVDLPGKRVVLDPPAPEVIEK